MTDEITSYRGEGLEHPVARLEKLLEQDACEAVLVLTDAMTGTLGADRTLDLNLYKVLMLHAVKIQS